MPKKAMVDVVLSSGNIFSDLEISDAEEVLAKARLAFQINKLIKAQGLTQKKAAKKLGVD